VQISDVCLTTPTATTQKHPPAPTLQQPNQPSIQHPTGAPRSWRIFSIDPITARDLDDALSIQPLPPLAPGGGPRWRVGVHIADVASFIKAGSALDEEAMLRGTST